GGTARDKGKNIFALGLICRIFNLDTDKLKGLITEKFKGKNPAITETALNAFNAGNLYEVGDLIKTFSFTESTKRDCSQIVMNGNEALGYGLIAAGVRFGAGYPITPWSDIMELLRRELPKYGGSFIQCEDEIASIAMALGASYAGRVAVTGSSGPGISLKTEALGWGIMAEIPLILVDVQRGGPSTGMPTNVEQSDLNIACFGGHGDSPRVVIAPANVEDCFYSAMEAVSIAREYCVPVVLLSDQAIATRIEAFDEPNLKELCKDITPDLTPIEEHKPYSLENESGVSPRVAPGTLIKSGKYPVITGLEHDELGHPTGSTKLHQIMTNKRRNKLKTLAKNLPSPKVYGGDEGDVLMVGWGSTQGPIHEAVDRVQKAGEKWSSLHIRHINPLPEGLEKAFAGFKHVMVIEMNDEGLYGYGQLAAILRARYCDPKIKGINKSDGLTYKVKEIIQRVSEVIS
ncbi:MAG: 2-oxoacid:acceptor oxidoreductase subunit alpha, partial [Verrucomicrobia bacterium]|nr:2-oxoacid:acceptor oxidoreductase subunit alpha [Verrucomicrobiota bacterium]